MKISTFTNQKDNNPVPVDASWEQLVDGLRDVRVSSCTLENCAKSDCAGKLGHAWSPASWDRGQTRKASTVKEVSALVVDLDKLDPDALFDQVERVRNFKLIVHASHSDREDKRSVRLVIALSKPVPGHLWGRFWDAALLTLGLTDYDRACRDGSRIYFLPSRPSDADYLFESQDGDVLNVDSILANLDMTEEPDSVDYVIPDFAGAPSEAAWTEAAALLAGAWPDVGRHDCHRALCGALAHAGWPVELIADFVADVCEKAHPGNGDRRKRLASARSAVNGIAAGDNVWGWTTVKEHIDPDTVNQAMVALGFLPKRDDNFLAEVSKWGIHDSEVSTEARLVTVSHDEIQTTLQAARRRLSRSSNAKKILEGKLIGRALDGKPFTEHADDDIDKAFLAAVKAITRHAPRGSSNIMLAEYLAKSRPDIPTDTLCEMVARAKASNADDDRAELPPDDFEIDPRTGKPVTNSQHNFDIALRRLNVTFHYDNFARKKIIETKVGEDIYRETVADKHIIKLMFEIERDFGFSPPKDKFYDYCAYRADQNEFHPVLNYLDGLPEWDGVPRLDKWLIDFGGAEDTPYVRAVSRLVLVAAVRRVRRPGCKFDEMLILESPQGTYKSTAIKALCPNGEWFSDNFNLEGDSKKMIEQTSGKWIVEAGELHGMSAKDHNALKQCLSSTHDEARMSYAREPQRLARQFIIIGTTNDSQYLRDHTGNRRFWPVKTDVFNVDALLKVREQIWAEASFLEAANTHDSYTRLDPSLYAAAAIEQSKRKVDNAVKVHLENVFGELAGRIQVSETWKLIGENLSDHHKFATHVSNAMTELGWTRVRLSKGWYYVKGTKEERKQLLIVTGSNNFGNLTVKPVNVDEHGNPVIDPVLGAARN